MTYGPYITVLLYIYFFTVSPYGDHLSLEFIHDLGVMAGIDILTPLAGNYKKLMSAAKVTLTKSQEKKLEECEDDRERLKIVFDQWKPGQGSHPRTWTSLLYILQNMNLNDLSQQIQDYLSEYSYTIIN